MGSTKTQWASVNASDRWPADWYQSEYYRDEIYSMIGRCLAAGFTNTETAYSVGVSSRAVDRYRERVRAASGRPRRTPAPKASEEDIKKWVAARETGMTFGEIARLHGGTERHIANTIRRVKQGEKK